MHAGTTDPRKECNAGELEGSGDGEGSGGRPRRTPISKTHGENRRLVVLRGVLVGWKKAIMALAVWCIVGYLQANSGDREDGR